MIVIKYLTSRVILAAAFSLKVLMTKRQTVFMFHIIFMYSWHLNPRYL